MSIQHRVLQASSSLLLSSFLALGCAEIGAPPEGVDGAANEEPSGGLALARAVVEGAAPPRRALATTSDGAIALISGDTGARIAASAPGDREVRSIAFDATAGLVLEAVLDDIDAGELVGIPFAGDTEAFGEPISLAWIDGDSRLFATPSGIVTFEQGYPSWGWSWSGAESNASAPLPPPLSVWIAGGAPPGAVRIETLTIGPPGNASPIAARQAAIASSAGIAAAPPSPLVGAIEDPTTARLVAIPAVGDALLASVEGGVLVARRVDGATLDAPMIVPGAIAAARVEAAIALSGGRVIVVATSGPAQLVAIRIDEMGAPIAAATIDLPSGFAVADRFFSSDLLPIADDRVLAATPAGVLAVDVAAPEGAISLAVDPGFEGSALRGPLAVSP